jgi:hypothetical protein
MKDIELRFRQVHLDFHTSEHIKKVGMDFDPEEFAATLEKAGVDSVTCFARCHHGWLYYDSKRFPERVHPHLVRGNLLAAQIEACHARNIKVPIYTTVQWDHYTAERQADWLMITDAGAIRGTAPYDPGFYRCLCVNTPYRGFLKEHVEDVLTNLPVDGLFFDIVQTPECSCWYCREGMMGAGLDPSLPKDRRKFAEETIYGFKREMTEFVRQFNVDCTIFYNAGHIGPYHRQVADAYTHFELESLPSGGWGYMHFPLTARYARNLGRDCLGMTGKFHTSWGDFHSFKNPAALQFECFQMLALNAKCSVGDQLHPSGRVCQSTYDLIGSVYREVAKKEEWCRGARAMAEIGVLTPEEFEKGEGIELPAAALGATRMLQEGRHQFDIIDSMSDFNVYRLLILPDKVPVSGELAEKIGDYVRTGGLVIASHRSGLNEEANAFALDELGVSLAGEARYNPDFVIPRGEIGKGLPETEHVMYLRGMHVERTGNAETLVDANKPYFNRNWRHFCSHQHAPSSGLVAYPAIVRKGGCIYFAHPVFTQYHDCAPLWCRKLVLNAINMLMPDPRVIVEGPSTMLAMLNEQTLENRLVLHLLHYIPERRGTAFDTIEDIIPLRNVHVSLRMEDEIARVVSVPDGTVLKHRHEHGRVRFVVHEVTGHAMVAVELAR